MAEKYSRFRDPGTGIQVFLTPVAAGSGGGMVLAPVLVVLGGVRVLLALLAWGVFVATGATPVLRVVLACFGFFALRVETVSRGRKAEPVARAGRGELVVCNHSSWLDILFLAHAHPGAAYITPVVQDGVAAAVRTTPRKNAMSAHTTIVTHERTPARSVVGYTALSLAQTLTRAGQLPLTQAEARALRVTPLPLAAVLAALPGPGVLFPEGTTSNNRALLAVDPSLALPPVRIHVVSIKYASPVTPLRPTATYSAPTGVYAHALRLLTSWPHRRVQLRAAPPAQALTLDEAANTLSSLARLKKTSLGWQDKADFLAMLARTPK